MNRMSGFITRGHVDLSTGIGEAVDLKTTGTKSQGLDWKTLIKRMRSAIVIEMTLGQPFRINGKEVTARQVFDAMQADEPVELWIDGKMVETPKVLPDEIVALISQYHFAKPNPSEVPADQALPFDAWGNRSSLEGMGENRFPPSRWRERLHLAGTIVIAAIAVIFLFAMIHFMVTHKDINKDPKKQGARSLQTERTVDVEQER